MMTTIAILFLATVAVCAALITFDILVAALNALTDWCERTKKKLKENKKC